MSPKPVDTKSREGLQLAFLILFGVGGLLVTVWLTVTLPTLAVVARA